MILDDHDRQKLADALGNYCSHTGSVREGTWNGCGDCQIILELELFPTIEKLFETQLLIGQTAEEELAPKRIRADSPPVEADSVLRGYRNLVLGIARANSLLPEAHRFHVPFGVQQVLADYIAADQAIASITKAALEAP